MKPIFPSIGLQVSSTAGGVYHLQAPDSKRQFVGLLFSEEPLHKAGLKLKLFLYQLHPGVGPDAVMSHWKNLDARRLEQSGITPQVITLSLQQIPVNYPADASAHRKFPRPDGDGERIAVELTTGELVCYN